MSVPARFGLVLSGGGARGAYEAGVIHYIRTALPEPYRSTPFPVITGASVGAVNATHLAALADNPAEQGIAIRQLWENLDQDKIYRREWGAIARFLLNTVPGMIFNFLRLNPGKSKLPIVDRRFKALFDTKPLPAYLRSLIDFDRIHQNIANGSLDALALAVTSLTTDRPELFVHKAPHVVYRGDYRWHDVQIGIDHVVASAAIPFAFTPVEIGGHYYCDGGIRLNTPMSPAIQLGANRILVIGMHAAEDNRLVLPSKPGHPGAGRMLAAITDALFTDRVRYDMEQLTRINRIIEWAEEVYGADFLTRINAYLVEKDLHGDIANRGLMKIQRLSIFPSRDPADIFAETLRKNPYLDKRFSPFERFVMRLGDIDPYEGRELFSILMFDPEYIRNLVQLGYDDAHALRTELIDFFSGAPVATHLPQFV